MRNHLKLEYMQTEYMSTYADLPGETSSQDKAASNDQAIKNMRLPHKDEGSSKHEVA